MIRFLRVFLDFLDFLDFRLLKDLRPPFGPADIKDPAGHCITPTGKKNETNSAFLYHYIIHIIEMIYFHLNLI